MATADIVRIDAAAGGVTLVTRAGRFDLEASLAEVHARLDPQVFVRVHRAHVVNLAHVTGIRRYDVRRLTVQMDDDASLVSSRQGARELRGLMA